MLINTKIYIDLERPSMPPVVNMTQNDANTRAVNILLFNGGEAWPIPDGVAAAVGYRKPDGTAGLYDKLPDGTGALSISGNTVTAIFAPQVLTVPGIVSAAIILTDDSMRQLSTSPFQIYVEKNPAAGLVVSDNYINVADAIGDLSTLVTEDKTSLVSAINEIARNGGGTISDEQIAQAVADYLSENPIDDGYATEQWVKDQNYLTEVPEGYAKTEDIPTKPEDIGALPNTYTPPNQTAEQVGADPAGTAATAVSQHNTDEDSHNDIRLELKAINDRLTAFFDSDDQTLDELSEIVSYITNNKTLIESITTSKVSVTDIINNLTTNVTNKPLSAAQGVVLKGLVDTLTTKVNGKPDLSDSEIDTLTAAIQ